VLREARARVRDRENLRFERTRLFGRVRRVFVELGRLYAAAGLLADPRDVFYLDLDEVLGAVDATVSCDDLAGLAAARRAAFARYAATPAPADRFLTHGLVLAGHDYTAAAPAAGAADAAASDDVRRGIGCYPGEVTGRVRVVRDPRAAELVPGEILVAERTDPGWVMLFPAAAALLVERGSLLSHSAIVARELGLPAVVSVPGLTGWLATGDTVTLDGRTGVVTRVARVGESAGDLASEPAGAAA
jgi:pyruvate,water dikinase